MDKEVVETQSATSAAVGPYASATVSMLVWRLRSMIPRFMDWNRAHPQPSEIVERISTAPVQLISWSVRSRTLMPCNSSKTSWFRRIIKSSIREEVPLKCPLLIKWLARKFAIIPINLVVQLFRRVITSSFYSTEGALLGRSSAQASINSW